MFRVLRTVLGHAAKETAIGTATALASTGIALGTYKGGASAFNFFQEQWKKSFQNKLLTELPMNASSSKLPYP